MWTGPLSSGHSEAHSRSRGRWWVWSVHSRLTADALELAGTPAAEEGRGERERGRGEREKERGGGERGRGTHTV